jgi:alpha-glucoside transport system substrate-binding protein
MYLSIKGGVFMPVYDRRNRRELDQLVEEYITTNNINRRQFLQRATALGLSISGASALLAACGGTSTSTSGTPSTVSSIDVLTVWSGNELANFQMQTAAFTQKTGIKVNVESTRDLPTVLNTRIRGNNPPDVSGSPGFSQFHTFATEGKLVALEGFIDMSYIQQNYKQTWIDFASYNGHLYGVLPKANSKGTIWYNPKVFQAAGYTTPTTWDDMIALSTKIAQSGKYPWSMGLASGAASGWPAADWIDQIYLSTNGPDMVDKWVAHKIPWTDPTIKNAFQMYGQIAHGSHFINGAPASILATAFQDASYYPYDSPPRAYMYYLGDFTAGFITAQFPSLQAGTDFDFFAFPTINSQYAGAITGGADMLFAMKNNNGTQQFMKFMSTAEAQTIWVKQGGASSVNQSVDESAYPNHVQLNAAKQLKNATFFRTSPDDLMPTAMENAYWKATLAYVANPGSLDSILSGLESTASQVYTS